VDILDDMGVRKLSAKVFLKVNYSFKGIRFTHHGIMYCAQLPIFSLSPAAERMKLDQSTMKETNRLINGR